MADQRITATELARALSHVLSRVRYRGERFVIERGGEIVASLGPAASPEGPTIEEFARLLASIPRPDDEFADDLERISTAQPAARDEFREWPSSSTQRSS